MQTGIQKIRVKNYRSLANVAVDLSNPMVLFGPNGSGKSSFLDTLWFMRDCAAYGVETASSNRSHGIGMLYDEAPANAPISISIETDDLVYELDFFLSSGRIDPYAGELLYVKQSGARLIERLPGGSAAVFHPADSDGAATTTTTTTLPPDNMDGAVEMKLRNPEKLSLEKYQDLAAGEASSVKSLDDILHNIRSYQCRSFDFYGIKRKGSESGSSDKLLDQGENIWSVLRNIHGKKRVDNRYDTIMDFMRRAFPDFDDLVFEPAGPSAIYGSFLFKSHSKPVFASGVSDGHLQMLLLLTALFSEEANKKGITVLFDEPDLSMHPWAIATFSKAVETAVSQWHRHVIMATHSPVLISQFDTGNIFATRMENGRTGLSSIGGMDDVKDLLDQYAAGSLYMAQLIAPQHIENESYSN